MSGIDRILFQIYEFFHPGLLAIYATDCTTNAQLLPLQPNTFKGCLFLFIGIFFELLYALCMMAMFQRKFMQIIPYRILFAIGCLDMISIVLNSILPGYWLITAQSFCQSPLLNLYIGSFTFPSWSAYVGLNVSLGINRLIDFTWPSWETTLFGGKRILFWTGVPTLYGLSLYFFLPPMLYYPGTGGYYFGVEPGKVETPLYYSISDIGVTAIMLLLNVLMIRAMYRRNATTMTKLQRVIMIQCLGMSITVLLCAWLYVLMQIVSMPQFMITGANLFWILSNASMMIFYLGVNKAMRKEVQKILRILLTVKPKPVHG